MYDTIWKLKILDVFGSEEQAMEVTGFVSLNCAPL
jgi:hypothetical protein